MVKSLNKVQKIVIRDFSNYDPNKSTTKEYCGFTTTYRRKMGEWYCEHTSTAEQFYCPNCGEFGYHHDKEQHGLTCSMHHVTDQKMIEIVNKVIESIKRWYVATDDGYIELSCFTWGDDTPFEYIRRTNEGIEQFRIDS